MQKQSSGPGEATRSDSPHPDTGPKPGTAMQNLILTMKVFLVAGAVIGALWLLDSLVS